MHRETVSSSGVRSVGYAADDGILEVEFVSGTIYRYYDVPLEIYVDFLAAESKGQFFNENIRDAFIFSERG